jgi:outer membrane protein TolC
MIGVTGDWRHGGLRREIVHRRRRRCSLLTVLLWASVTVHSATAQTYPAPTSPNDRQPTSHRRGRSPLGGSPAPDEALPPPAPEPVPGPAGSGLPVRGIDPRLPPGLPINLATALQLSGVRPIDIAVATAQVRQALSLQTQAKALWIPNLNAGLDYFRHDGQQQNLFTGENFQLGRQNLFVGGGPSLSVGLADAVFAPLAARRVVGSRQADLQAARNDTLYAVTQVYFEFQAARGRLLGTGASLSRAELLVRFTKGLAPGLIPPLEINRALTELQSLRQTQQVAIRDCRIASARLAEILLLDPTTMLEPIEPALLQVTLVSAERSAEDLVPIALNSRPEIASRRRAAAAAQQLVRQEQWRPFVPNLYILSPATTTGLLGAGTNIAGPNGLLNSSGSRMDYELAAVWQLQNAGIGNVGRIRQRRAEQDVATLELTRIVFRVRSEIAQAVARLQTARNRVVETEEEVRQAIESADKNFVGLRQTARPGGELLQLVVRPQEVVAAIIALNTAYEQYANAISEYNVAQFELYHALGQPAQWIAPRATALLPPLPQAPPNAPSAPANARGPR